jgi:hypothetical protein
VTKEGHWPLFVNGISQIQNAMSEFSEYCSWCVSDAADGKRAETDTVPGCTGRVRTSRVILLRSIAGGFVARAVEGTGPERVCGREWQGVDGTDQSVIVRPGSQIGTNVLIVEGPHAGVVANMTEEEKTDLQAEFAGTVDKPWPVNAPETPRLPVLRIIDGGSIAEVKARVTAVTTDGFLAKLGNAATALEEGHALAAQTLDRSGDSDILRTFAELRANLAEAMSREQYMRQQANNWLGKV